MNLTGFYNMDCMEGMKDIPDNYIDLTVTSPPYDELRSYNGYIFDFENTAKELYRITKKGGILVWIVGDQTVNGTETGTSFKQALFFKEIGFNLHDTMIWKKETFSFPESNRYPQIFEYMFILTKDKPNVFNPIKDRKTVYAGTKIHVTQRQKDGSMVKKEKSGIVQDIASRFNVWEISTEKSNKTNHPAVFPINLVKDHISSWSNEGDIVLDPFSGSGTTAIACHDLKRRFIGFEISKDYYKMANERLEKHKAQLNMFLDF